MNFGIVYDRYIYKYLDKKKCLFWVCFREKTFSEVLPLIATNIFVMRKLMLFFTAGIFLAIQACNSQPETNAIKTDQLSGKVNSHPAEAVGNPNPGSGKAVIMAPVHITKSDFLEKIMDYEKNSTEWIYRGSLPCLIDFYADWCAPCRQTAPILDELALEYSGKIVIYKVDVQKEKELASVFGIQSIPAFLFCPMKGNPSMSAGIGGSRDATKKMFIQQIDNFLLKETTGSTEL
jgi:thioredoxin 1